MVHFSASCPPGGALKAFGNSSLKGVMIDRWGEQRSGGGVGTVAVTWPPTRTVMVSLWTCGRQYQRELAGGVGAAAKLRMLIH
jgi:hypothetical protein